MLRLAIPTQRCCVARDAVAGGGEVTGGLSQCLITSQLLLRRLASGNGVGSMPTDRAECADIAAAAVACHRERVTLGRDREDGIDLGVAGLQCRSPESCDQSLGKSERITPCCSFIAII
eukprot:SAG22_NODE_23_length_31399_cov_35.631313_26_plen_119_part_00